ncbi:MAG: phosphoribosylformylglycinamidine synthase subunit PurS, partial [Sulfobacillus thermotolerans]|nr:phosphoribosylformylglycinamidine synthase subunit PurS [Sulfobacillus thermotolerans]
FDLIVNVAWKEEILDPAGQSTTKVLQQMGYAVDNVRIGKQIRLQVEAQDQDRALEAGREMAKRLLANPVMETYTVQVVEA